MEVSRKMAALKILILYLVAVAFAYDDDSCSEEDEMEEKVEMLGNANNFLAVKLLRTLSSDCEENLLFSPFTISSVLSMLYQGAKGETAQELRKMLGYHIAKLQDSEVSSTFHYYLTEVLGQFDPRLYTIHCASALIVDTTFLLRPSYRTQVQDLYQAYVQDGDITQDSVVIADRLNTWVKIKSKGTIKSLVKAVDPAAALLLLSAAYFKGNWRIRFDPQDTKYHPFCNGGRRSNMNDVLMMHATGSYRYFEGDGEHYRAIELMYEGRNMSMVIFLPDEDDGLYELEQNLTPEKMALVRRNMLYTKVHLTVPKFKLLFNRDLSKDLQKCGVNQVFSSAGDLSGMTDSTSPLAVSEVRHKAMIDVNEKGSMAAAISTLIMTKMIPMTVTVPEFVVNHPFLFIIVDTRNGLILFVGRINKL